MLVNASASPFVVGKHEFRLELFGAQAKQFGKPLVYVNQVGGNDELVFDGNSVAFDAEGNVIAQAKEFEEDLLVVDIPPHVARASSPSQAGSMRPSTPMPRGDRIDLPRPGPRPARLRPQVRLQVASCSACPAGSTRP